MLVQELSLRMDRNGDGHLSYNELRAMLESDAFDCGYEDVEEAGSTGCDDVETITILLPDGFKNILGTWKSCSFGRHVCSTL